MEIALDPTPGAQRFSSRIEGMTEKQMFVAMPMSKSVPVLLLPGTKFYGRAFTNGMIWQFTSTFIDKKMLPVPIWICESPYDLKKVQLRSFVRIPATLPITIRVQSDDPETLPVVTTTKDISGGGLQFISKKGLPVGSVCHVTVDLPEIGTVQSKATVVRADQPPDTNIYWVAVNFVEIAEKDREKIIKFIFKKQCEMRQKGLT